MSKEMRQQMDTFKQRLTENLNVSDVSSSLLNEGKKYEFIDEHPSSKWKTKKKYDIVIEYIK